VRPRTLGRVVAAYLVVVALLCIALRVHVGLHPPEKGEAIASVWSEGKLVYREALPSVDAPSPGLAQALEKSRGRLVHEVVIAEGPMWTWSEMVLGLSLVAGRDGVRATLGDRVAYVTPDDLLSAQAYDHGMHVQALSIALGFEVSRLVALLAERLGTGASDVLERASLRRIRVERRGAPEQKKVTPDTLDAATVRTAIVDAARFLARGVGADGRYRYIVDAPTNKNLPGYDWPRHAGATYFLAQAAALTHEPLLVEACAKAAGLLRGDALLKCGNMRCVGSEHTVDVGSSALGLLAMTEVVRTQLDLGYTGMVKELARFLRSQQRPDGEFMHLYDRDAKRPVDRQFLYYSGEATLALARAYSITHDPADLAAASRGLAHLVGPAWSFFGDRYYFGEEHWTCQAVADLWAAAPDPRALDFCLRWQGFNRAIQQREGDSSFDADGAIGVGPVVTPRLTPVASRCEAGVATLEVARMAGTPAPEIAALEAQMRRALSLILRHQFRPGPAHLFARPEDVYGAIPGSEVDWQLRIDYAQHAGSALVRWLEVEARRGPS
jgi:hypothetical protein